MKNKVVMIVQILLGLIFFVFGLNGFFHFLPMSNSMPIAASGFMGALISTGYMFSLIKGVEVVGGFLLLTNMWVPLSLAILAPNVVNIVLFHTFLAPSGLPIAIAVLIFELFLAWSYRKRYSSMLSRK
ncbi:DoxX family protein [Fluviispira multicolorata]|uniref:DoxX family protein n=1 Tax=Fluviispira multicolorata TaxID=2654512 RepID=A0A833JFE4_9BACT|nr:DoxX family protein [Fluviispira multicolorata]KAB8033660.1 DoxX family protein [Fluviispira multicolorata]